MAVQHLWVSTEPGVSAGPFASELLAHMCGYDCMSEIRDLTGHEREVLEFLLQGEWDGAAALREQLSTAKHAGSWSPAEASFSIAVDENLPRAQADLAHAPTLDDLYLK